VVSATEANAYPETNLHRTMALIKDANFENPFLIDIMKINAATENQYDLPYYYFGQLMSTNFEYTIPEILKPLGTKNGYQHLWNQGEGKTTTGNAKVSWFNKSTFYTLTTVVSANDDLLFASIGAKDPDFNLRTDPTFIIRKNKSKNTSFVSVIETHGNYSPVTENATNAFSNINNVEVVYSDDAYMAVVIETILNEKKLFLFSFKDASKESSHNLKINEMEYQWVGPYNYTNLK
jgi:hypothetical protein